MQRLPLLILKVLLAFIAVLVLLVVALLAGFRQQFPGEAIANYIESQARRQAGLQLEIEPIQLEWTHLSTPSVTFPSPPQLWMLPLKTLAQLDQVTLPFLPILRFQQFWVQSQLYQSDLKLTVDLPGMSNLNISLDELMLQQVPLANALPFGFPAGVLSLEVEIKNLAQLQRRQQLLPIGTLQGSMTDFRFRLNQEHPLLNGLSITELNLPEVSYAISMQQQLIEISQLTLNGDLEGNITGNIRINERNLLESRIDLDLKVRLSQKLQDQLGLFTMMLQGFRCGDFLDVKIRGTFRQISPPFRKRCT